MQKAFLVTPSICNTLKKCLLLQVLCMALFLTPQQSFTQPALHFTTNDLKELEVQKKDTLLVNRYISIAAQFASPGSDSLLLYTAKAIALAQKLNYQRGLAEAHSISSKYYRSQGAFAEALEHGLLRLQTVEKAGTLDQLANSHVDIAQIYKDMVGQRTNEPYINMGIEYARKGYGIYNNIRDTAGMVLCLNMQGILQRDKAKVKGKAYLYDTVLHLYNRAFALINASGKGVQHTGKLYNNISQVYIEHKKDYPKALGYLFKALAFNQAGNNTSSLSYNYGNISNAYNKMNDFDNGLKYARLMHAATVQQNAPLRIQNACQSLFHTFELRGQMDSALHYYMLADQLDDSLTNVAKTRQVMDLQVQYETAKKQREINLLSAIGADQDKRLAQLLVFAVLITCAAATMILLYRRVSVQKKELALQSHRLELVMKELHHRVKNNLQIVSSLLSLQTYKLQETESVNILKESQQRVQAMSLIHQRLYTRDMLTSINMKEYITDLAESLLASYGYSAADMDLVITVDKELLDVEKALPIGLLVNEMVTNALKYAFDGVERPALWIALTRQQEELTLVVKDNGAGIDLAAWNGKGTSFGKQLIRLLGKQLRAKESVLVNGGTEFTLRIPLAA